MKDRKKAGIPDTCLLLCQKKYPVRQHMARLCRMLPHRVVAVFFMPKSPGNYLRAAALAAARASSDM